MMARAIRRLTAGRVASETWPGYYADGLGLYLHVAKGGGKSWVFRYQRAGRRREMGLGSTSAVPLSLARKKAAALRRQLATGKDPLAVKRAAADALQPLTHEGTGNWVSRADQATIDDRPSRYTDDVLDRIIEAGGGLPDGSVEVVYGVGSKGRSRRVSRREQLRRDLERAADEYVLASALGPDPSPAMLADASAIIDARVRNFLHALRGSGAISSRRGPLHRVLRLELAKEAAGIGSLGAVSGTWMDLFIGNLEALLRAASAVHNQMDSVQRTSPPKRHAGDVHLNNLVRHLARTWLFVFERWPTTSVISGSQGARRDGKADGPFLRFVAAALRPVLDEVPSEDAIRARLRRLFGDTGRSAKSTPRQD